MHSEGKLILSSHVCLCIQPEIFYQQKHFFFFLLSFHTNVHWDQLQYLALFQVGPGVYFDTIKLSFGSSLRATTFKDENGVKY